MASLMRRACCCTLLFLLGACVASRAGDGRPAPVVLTQIARAEVDEINRDLRPGPLTMDVGIILPANLDPGFDEVSLELLLDGVRFAKGVFAAADVQLQLLWVKTGTVPKSSLSIPQGLELGMPASRHLGMYTRYRRHPARLHEDARELFDAVIEPHPDNARTLYLVVLQDVFMPYYAEREGDYLLATTPTSGLSFPGYMLGDQVPMRLRGAITLTNLKRGKNPQKTLAHELGHKVLNVSHEYRETAPGFEIVGEGGLMIYGAGTEIPKGEEGRWHYERLQLSPYLYRLDDEGRKQWNPDYEEHGHYFDPIYGDACVR